jgi:hypothetical protein
MWFENSTKPVAEAAAVAKEQAEKARSDYQDVVKASHDVLEMVNKLKADLAAATAKDDRLQEIHDQTSAVRAATARADTANRARSGHATPAENQDFQIDQNYESTLGAHGPGTGMEAFQTVQQARDLMRSIGGRQPSQNQTAQINEFAAEVLGYLQNQHSELDSQRTDLTEAWRQLRDLQSRQQIGRDQH